MLRKRTLAILMAILLVYGLLWLPAVFAPSYPDSQAGAWLVAPLLVVYALHRIGVPGLLEQDGLCGWGWCAPTALGWFVAATILLLGLWLLAWAIAVMTARSASR